MTKYVILAKTADKTWVEEGIVEASSAKAAISAYATTAEIAAGTFVAPPARSFEPLTIETKTRVAFK